MAVMSDLSAKAEEKQETSAAVAPMPTGGDKTTLINLLMRFYELNSGAILIDGVDISTIPRAVLRRQIGMVLQDTWLFEGSVAENLSYGKMGTLPDGYDTVISGDNATLS